MKATPIRPLFPYYGSKWNIARNYPVPQHGIVCEPFAGSAGYSLFYGVDRAVLNEADPILAGLWRYLIAATEQEILALPNMLEVGDYVDNYAIPQEAKWLIGFWLNRGSATPKKSRTAYSARTDKAQLNWGQAAKERIAGSLHRIRNWSITEGSYDSLPDARATWFVDPPYTHKGKYYRVKFEDFDRLGEWCLSRLGSLIVCEGPGANWLPFRPLGSFKSSLDRALEFVFVSI